MSIIGQSETQVWNARAAQARRLASMLSPGDAALLEAYATECDDRVRATLCKITERHLPSGIARARDPDQTARQAPHRKRAA